MIFFKQILSNCIALQKMRRKWTNRDNCFFSRLKNLTNIELKYWNEVINQLHQKKTRRKEQF